MALIPLNTFKTKTSVLTTLKYNQAKCARDTGLIIDSIAFDLLYGGNTQTAFAAVQYWSQGKTKIPGEVFQTLAAMEHAKKVALKIAKSELVSPTPGNTETQVLGTAGSDAAVDIIESEFNLIIDIIENGIAGTTNKIEPNSMVVSDSGMLNASTLLGSNKAFLQEEVKAFVDDMFYTGYKYDQVKCARDTGLIIDSLAFDLLFGGSTQSTFSALQYWGQGNTSIPAEALQTLAAIDYIKSMMLDIISNQSITASNGNTLTQITNTTLYVSDTYSTTINELFGIITGIINNGTNGVTDQIISNGLITTDELLLDVYSLIQANKKFVQSEIDAWISNNIAIATSSASIWYNFVYNRDNCYRDVGYIIDCISFDLIYGGNRQSIQAGTYYYEFSNASQLSVNSGQFTSTESTISGTTLTVGGVISGTIAIGQYLQGTNVISGTYITGGSGKIWTVNNTQNVATTAISSIPLLPYFTSTASMIIGTTLTIGGTLVGTVAKGQYITGSGITDGTYIISGSGTTWTVSNVHNIGTPISITTAKFSSTSSYISGTTLTISGLAPNSVIAKGQYISGNNVIAGTYIVSGSGTTWTVNKNQNVSTTNISSYGSYGVSDEVSQSISAYNYLKDLVKMVIEGQPVAGIYQNDVKQVITTSYGTSLQSEIAEKNIDLITNIILNGPSTATEIKPISLEPSIDTSTINAFEILLANKNFLKAEVIEYINTTTQSGFTYVTRYDAGSFIPGNVYTVDYVGTTTDWNTIAGTTGITYTHGSTFTAVTAGTGNGTATADFCKRDIGFIVDCIRFDLEHSGNRQAIQAGVYYYNNSSTTSVVASEKTDTLNAYNYMGIVMAGVLQNTRLTQPFVQNELNGTKYVTAPYQTDVQMFISLQPSTTSVVTSMYNLISNTLYPIINLGPSMAPTRVPIGLTASTNTDIVKGFNLLMANKDYIIAEVIGYMDSLNTPNTTKIYTAPPGVTGIVLMAQVSNVTNHTITVTFAHYRNLPVFADPATLNGYQSGDTVTEIVKEFSIPPNDSASLIQGKMIIESFDSIVAYASESSGLKVTLSILETANA
jgi:hypothetical protein